MNTGDCAVAGGENNIIRVDFISGWEHGLLLSADYDIFYDSIFLGADHAFRHYFIRALYFVIIIYGGRE